MSYMLLCQGWISTSSILLVADTAVMFALQHPCGLSGSDEPHAAVPWRPAEEH